MITNNSKGETNMKKLICKVFRISPIKHYSLTIEFKSERVLRVNDIIFTTDKEEDYRGKSTSKRHVRC